MSWSDEANAGPYSTIGIDGTSDVLALQIAAAYVRVPHELVWNQAIEHSSRCEFAWGDFQSVPNRSVEGWLASRSELPLAEFCRQVGRAAWDVLRWAGRSQEDAIAVATAEVAAWLANVELQSAPAVIPSDNAAARQPTTSAVRVRGPLIAL
jgi:hypothetical protein